jgi:hypothetical protein
VWRASVIFISPTKMLHVDQGNHGLYLPINTPLHMVGYFYFKSSPNIFFPNILTQHNFPYLFNFSTSFSNHFTKPNTLYFSKSYSLNLIITKMSQSPKQTSPSTTNSPQLQPSDVITDVVPISAVPLTVIHPSFSSALKFTTSEPFLKNPFHLH